MYLVQYILVSIKNQDWLWIVTKGQIKSEWLHEDIDFPNYHLKYLKDLCPAMTVYYGGNRHRTVYLFEI